jgi:hypothetical protein
MQAVAQVETVLHFLLMELVVWAWPADRMAVMVFFSDQEQQDKMEAGRVQEQVVWDGRVVAAPDLLQ